MEGGPLHAKHQAAVVIHPRYSLHQNMIFQLAHSTYLVKVPRSEAQQAQSSQTNDTARQRLGLYIIVREQSLIWENSCSTHIEASSASEKPTMQAPKPANREP